METLLALEATDGAMDIDFSSDEEDEEVEEYLTSLGCSGSVVMKFTVVKVLHNGTRWEPPNGPATEATGHNLSLVVTGYGWSV